MPKMNLDWDTAISFITEAFVGAGVPREDAEICTDVLLESDRRGIESHGCNRFKPIYIDRIKAGIQQPVTEFEILKETETTAVIDGHHGMGQVIGYKAIRYGYGCRPQLLPLRHCGLLCDDGDQGRLYRYDGYQRPPLRCSHLRR